MIDRSQSGAQDVGVIRHGFVDIQDEIAALSVRHLFAATGDVTQTSSEIRQMRLHKNHASVAVFIAVRDFEPFDGMMPKHAPSGAFWHIKASDFSVIRMGRHKLACYAIASHRKKEEGTEPPS